ncbi:hypothetical protein QE152_g28522 [Popillia japonica]|uniref:SWIM-type domain-containing protein n=1 Tax=Popillia japonica TaxID=7064 RepID=A0AAW1JJB3_POPJA
MQKYTNTISTETCIFKHHLQIHIEGRQSCIALTLRRNPAESIATAFKGRACSESSLAAQAPPVGNRQTVHRPLHSNALLYRPRLSSSADLERLANRQPDSLHCFRGVRHDCKHTLALIMGRFYLTNSSPGSEFKAIC